MPIIIFIRHGETDWNVEGRFQGQRDIPLNDRGRGQARRNGFFVADHFPEASGYDFVSSPLMRTCETMRIVRGAMGLPPEGFRLDPALKELTFGSWEGFTSSELAAGWPDEMVERDDNKWEFIPPGGESYAMLLVRIGGWLKTVTRDTVVVSHGGVCRVLCRLLTGLDAGEAATLDIPQDKIFYWNGSSAAWL